MAAHALADGALRDQFQLKALGAVRIEKGAVVAGARIGADHLADPTGIDQTGQPVIAIAGILFVKGDEQMIGNPDGAEASHQYRRTVANPGHGVGGGIHTLVNHGNVSFPASGQK